MSLVSIEDLAEKPTALVNSPRSLRACNMEGILPKELVKAPTSEFNKDRKSKAIVQMRIKFFEEKRQELIGIVSAARQRIIDEEVSDPEEDEDHPEEDSLNPSTVKKKPSQMNITGRSKMGRSTQSMTGLETQSKKQLELQGIYKPNENSLLNIKSNRKFNVMREKVGYEKKNDDLIQNLEQKEQQYENKQRQREEDLHTWKKKRHTQYIQRVQSNKMHEEFMVENSKKEYQLELVNEMLDNEDQRQSMARTERKRQKEFKRLDQQYEKKLEDAERIQNKRVQGMVSNQKMKFSKSQSQLKMNTVKQKTKKKELERKRRMLSTNRNHKLKAIEKQQDKKRQEIVWKMEKMKQYQEDREKDLVKTLNMRNALMSQTTDADSKGSLVKDMLYKKSLAQKEEILIKMHEKEMLKKKVDKERDRQIEFQREEMKLKHMGTQMANKRKERISDYERTKVMQRLSIEQEKMEVYKKLKEDMIKQRQFTGLVEHMKYDALEQKHLEMKWVNKYTPTTLDKIQERMNPYKNEKRKMKNADQVFSEGLKQFNQAQFPKSNKREMMSRSQRGSMMGASLSKQLQS